jgi:SM-20-related protein
MTTQQSISGDRAASAPLAHARCPHIVFHDVLGAQKVASLLRHVQAHEQDFVPAPSRQRGVAGQRIDEAQRKCLLLGALGEFRAPFQAFVRSIAPQALARLGLIEPHVEPKEFQISAHRDGGHFVTHVDTVDDLARVRVLSCVYYFSATPRRFSGGELRLHGFPVAPGGSGRAAPSTVDIAPEPDTLVVFPSWLSHEVRPVRVPSGAFADSRFAIYCWFHRAAPAAPASASGDKAG